MSYRKWLEGIPLPPWLRRHWGSRLAYLVALLADAVLEGVRLGVRARFPSVAPDDALLYLAEDRLLEPGLTEDPETLRTRILDVWEAWPWGGTEMGMLDQLRAWLPSATWAVVANNEWSVPPEGRPASPDWDPGHGKRGDTDYRPPRGTCAITGDEWWSRMWVICQSEYWRSDGVWGDPGSWGDGGTWGSTALAHHIETCKRIVRLWKAGHEYVPEIIVLLRGGDLWGYPGGTWGDPGTWGQPDVVRWHIA